MVSLTCKTKNGYQLSSLKLHTDSARGSALGCGVYFDGHWCHLSWPDQWSKSDFLRDIAFLELVPIDFTTVK